MLGARQMRNAHGSRRSAGPPLPSRPPDTYAAPGSLPEAGVEGRVLAPAPPGVSQLVGGRVSSFSQPQEQRLRWSLVQAVREESVKGGPRWLSGKESACQRRRRGFDPWVGKIPWRRKWQPAPVSLPGESHGQRSLAGYSPWGHEKSDISERVHTEGVERNRVGHECAGSASVGAPERPDRGTPAFLCPRLWGRRQVCGAGTDPAGSLSWRLPSPEVCWCWLLALTRPR